MTNAGGGESFHNYRVALDFVPVIHGKAIWNDPVLFKKCGAIAEGLGFEWGGSWKSFKDLPHIQITNGLSIADFKAGKSI